MENEFVNSQVRKRFGFEEKELKKIGFDSGKIRISCHCEPVNDVMLYLEKENWMTERNY